MLELILVSAIATAVTNHLFIISPIVTNLKKEKPSSFGASNPKTVKLTSFALTLVTFPLVIIILAVPAMSKTFHETLEATFGEE